jgi:putative PIN family toxin of toxin-antitoxin system
VRIVLDTNVVVSGVIDPHGPAGRCLDLVLAGELTLLHDDRILAEYREILLRPRFAFRRADVGALVGFFVGEGEPVHAPPLDCALPDPDDLPFLEVAAAGAADALVTGNLRHFPEAAVRPAVADLRILSPRAVVDRLAR